MNFMPNCRLAPWVVSSFSSSFEGLPARRSLSARILKFGKPSTASWLGEFLVCGHGTDGLPLLANSLRHKWKLKKIAYSINVEFGHFLSKVAKLHSSGITGRDTWNVHRRRDLQTFELCGVEPLLSAERVYGVWHTIWRRYPSTIEQSSYMRTFKRENFPGWDHSWLTEFCDRQKWTDLIDESGKRSLTRRRH